MIQMEDGRWVDDQLVLKDMAITYCRSLHASNPLVTGNFMIGSFPHLSTEKQLELNKKYTKDEVVQALKGMGALKAPVPDGLQAVFYQRAWNIAGEDVRSSVLSILKEDKLRLKMAEALLVLIPKKEKPENIKQFCSISLCNVTFKLTTKVLVNRLKNIMEEVVSPN